LSPPHCRCGCTTTDHRHQDTHHRDEPAGTELQG
jgi:hypothetical protein